MEVLNTDECEVNVDLAFDRTHQKQTTLCPGEIEVWIAIGQGEHERSFSLENIDPTAGLERPGR